MQTIYGCVLYTVDVCAQSISHAEYRTVVSHASQGLSSNDAGSSTSASKPGSVDKPAVPVSQSLDNVYVKTSAGESTAQSHSNRLHRKY